MVNKVKRFLTLFPELENVHLVKDVGMVPFILQQELGYVSTIASYENGTYPFLADELKGLNQVFIKRISGIRLLDGLWFLLLNFRKFDIVQAYHLRKESFIWLYIFRLLTLFRGKSYLKLDEGERIKTLSYTSLRGSISLFFLKRISLVSTETFSLYTFLNSSNLLGRPVVYLPNGFYDGKSRIPVAVEKKKNVLLTVGRIGSAQKATEILLDSFAMIAAQNPDWDLEIIGPIEPAFRPAIQEYFTKHPFLLDRVCFHGEIADRQQLSEKYRNAKIFTLPSRWEGFPLVYLEALHSGCFMLLSDIAPAHDVIGNGQYGELFPVDNTHEYASAMNRVINNVGLEGRAQEIQDFAYQNFYWPGIIRKLHQHLQDL